MSSQCMFLVMLRVVAPEARLHSCKPLSMLSLLNAHAAVDALLCSNLDAQQAAVGPKCTPLLEQ